MASGQAAVVTVTLNPAVDVLCHVPGLALGGHLPATIRSRTPAGKGVNVSRVLAELGVASVATGWLPGDGRAAFSHLHDRIDCRWVSVAGTLRENLTLTDPAADPPRELHLRMDADAEITPADVELLTATLREASAGARAMVVAGSLPASFSARAFGRLLGECKQLSGPLIVDSSGDALAAAVSAGVALIKPNVDELAALLARALDSESAVLSGAAELLPRVPQVLVSAGENGAYLVTAAGRWHARRSAPIGRVAHTVGAGDAFLAGFVAALARDQPPSACLANAVATASAYLQTGQESLARHAVSEMHRVNVSKHAH